MRNQNFAMFLLLDRKVGDQETNKWLTALINDHISNLWKKWKITFQHLNHIQQPFIGEMNSNEQLNFHEQHLELQSSQAATTKFSSSSLIKFWCSMLQKYLELAKRALEALIPFPTTYLCEAAMSAQVNIKTMYRDRLRVANDMRIVLSNMLLLLFTRPLLRDGGMAEDHGASEAGQLPRVWTRGRKETESRQRVSDAKSP